MDNINDMTEIKETDNVNNDFEIMNNESVNNQQERIETLDDLNFNGFTPIVNEHILEDEVLEDLPSFNSDNLLEENIHDTTNDNLNNDLATDIIIDNETLDVKEDENNKISIDDTITDNTDSLNEEETLDSSKSIDQPINEIDNINEFEVDDQLVENEVDNIGDEDISVSQNDTISNDNEQVNVIKNDGLDEIVESVNEIETDNANVEEIGDNEVSNEDNENSSDISVDDVPNSNSDNPQSKPLLEKYGDNLTVKEYVCNPAIGRDNEIKQLILTLLTPEKSAILVGKPGIGKTAIVEGLSYQINRGNVPTALNGYTIYKLNTSSLLGVMPDTNEPKIQVLLNELKGTDKLILFIDEIHTLIGAGAEGGDSLDFANIFKPGLDRGSIKVIGATTSDEYDHYILTDKAFVRRFQKIEVLEPTKEHTVKIMMGSLPKLEHKTHAKLKYTPFIQEKIMQFIVDITSEYRRVYELSARYPDVSLTILQQAFSYAVFDNKKEVSIRDVRKAIVNTKLVYPDVIKKELIRFNEIFSDIYRMETVQRLKGETSLPNE